ncbi:hypothetical protein HYALB_00004945 [Hymenoscyphus albidus]|uniref:Ribosome biogenesis protein Alb1 n=1 Tax=Hymenoscyphus albidus TaxID=595503 RepID=A0A9N9LBB6_9HELO|nr:hypothetical protein HYALB_00004945 [Hymenoscyphus albidus]
MAKTAPKKNKAPASIHSRAVRRAASPGIDLDKSLKDVKPPTDARDIRPSVLAIHQGAGISKKNKNGRKSVLSAKAARRKEKGMDRAEAFMDRKSIKVEKSKGRARNIQERSKAWEEQNKKILEQQAKEEAERIEAAERLQKEKDEWIDEAEMEDVEESTEVAENIPLPEGDDEIL